MCAAAVLKHLILFRFLIFLMEIHMNANATKTTIAQLLATPLTLNQDVVSAAPSSQEIEALSATEIHYVGGGTAVVNCG